MISEKKEDVWDRILAAFTEGEIDKELYYELIGVKVANGQRIIL